jgi:hypothetical protein
MEDVINDLQNQLTHEREQFLAQRQQYDAFIQQLTYERDEAIRSKTLETGEVRRQNNVLKDCVRELERQQATRGFTANEVSEPFDSYSLGLEDNFLDDQFGLIHSEDLDMRGEDTPHRQLTPRPPPPTTSEPEPSKQDPNISLNAFYLCLLFGAFFTSTFTNKDSNMSSTAAPSDMPEDYKIGADDLLEVLTNGQDFTDIRSTQRSLPATVSGHELSYTSQPASAPGQPTSSSLDNLAQTLTQPTRRQSAIAAFSLSESSYNHITNPEGLMNTPSPSSATGGETRPTRMESMYKLIQQGRDDIDRMSGLGGKARQRGALLDTGMVPEKVLRDFRDFKLIVQAREEKKGS